MNRIIGTAILVVLLLLPGTTIAAPTQYQLLVDGLACPFCAYGIEKELTRTEGLESIDIDINAGTVTVTMADGATFTESQADQIVKDAGFTLNSFQKLGAPSVNTQD